MKKRLFYFLGTVTLTVGALVLSSRTNETEIQTMGENCNHSNVVHYDGVKPTTSSRGRLEHWACCSCHKAFYDAGLTREIEGADLDRTIIDIEKKTTHSWYGKENVKDDEIKNISTAVGDVNCLTQTDWGNYPSGIGPGTYYYYTCDTHPAVYLDAESFSWTPSRVTARDNNNGGNSTFKFNSNLSSLSKVSFDYKYWDIKNDLDSNGNHISISTSDAPGAKYKIELIPDNKWHSFSYEFISPIQATKLVFDVYKFIGELYISDMHYNSFEVTSGPAYDISTDSSWASKHVAQFGLPNNVIPISSNMSPLTEDAIQIVRDGTTYNAATIGATMLTKETENRYSINDWWILNKSKLSSINNGDLLIINGTFAVNSGDNSYKLTIQKTEIIFVSIEGAAYSHYVNQSGNVISDFVTSTKTTYRWFMSTTNATNVALGGMYKPTLKSNFQINGIDVANVGIQGLYQSATDRGEICVLDTDQGFSALKNKGAKLKIEGYFVNTNDSNNYIYIPLTTFYYDGNAVYRIYNDIDTSSLSIGIWNGNHHFTNDNALLKVAEAGIDNVIAVNPIWNSNWNHTMELANKNDITFYCDPRTWDYNNNCYKEWDGTKPIWMDDTSIGGLIVYDEPNINQFSKIKSYKQLFDQNIGGTKEMFVNLNCSCVSETALYGSESYSTNENYYKDYAQAYTTTYDADLYGFDSYGLMANGTIRKSFYCDLDVWSHFSKQDGKDLWYSILTTPHTSGDGYKFATNTIETMRWKMNLGLTFGSKGIVHYLFATSDSDYDSIADNDGNIINESLFNIVKTADNEIKNWDEIYSQYTWLGYTTHDTGNDNKMFQFLRYKSSSSDLGITSTTSTQNLIIGAFTNAANQKAYMITNAGKSTRSSYSKRNSYIDNCAFSMASGTATIKFDQSYSKVIIIKNGVKTLQNLNSNTLSVSYDAYDGMFVIPF